MSRRLQAAVVVVVGTAVLVVSLSAAAPATAATSSSSFLTASPRPVGFVVHRGGRRGEVGGRSVANRAAVSLSSPRRRPHQRRHRHFLNDSDRGVVRLSAHYLTSAIESLARERAAREREDYGDDDENYFYRGLKWFDPTSDLLRPQDGEEEDAPTSDSSEKDSEVATTIMTLPLYPLPAVYLPYTSSSNVTHTLINIEPRNLRMARDLLSPVSPGGAPDERRFCAALRAVDSGRVASVGTVLRIIDHEENIDGTRMVLTCLAEHPVEILNVVNPQAASWENRILRRSDEYLLARVRVVQPQQPSGNGFDERLVDRVVEDYNHVRNLYSRSRIAKLDLPPFARDTVSQSLPPLAKSNFTLDGGTGIWDLAQTWQTLCNTVREGRQIRLSSDRNELVVAAGMKQQRKKSQPLKLPIHVEDLSREDRQRVQDLEVEAQSEWVERVRLDPCLDFQVLLSLLAGSTGDGGAGTDGNIATLPRLLHFLARMIRRERIRLEEQEEEELEVSSADFATVAAGNSTGTDGPSSSPPRRKGAWFNDEDW